MRPPLPDKTTNRQRCVQGRAADRSSRSLKAFTIDVGEATDLTYTIENEMTIYVGDPIPRISKFKRIEKDGVNVSIMTWGSHAGTHVDAPVPFVGEGDGGGRATS